MVLISKKAHTIPFKSVVSYTTEYYFITDENNDNNIQNYVQH